LNTTKYKTYEDRKKDPEFLKRISREKVIKTMEKTGKLPKQSTLEKYDIKGDEIKEVMEPQQVTDERLGIIYKISSPSGKVYVGQTVRSFETRVAEHKSKFSGCTLLKKAINKYGDEMIYEIIEGGISQEHLDEKENYWINHFNSLAPSGYNLMTGGHYERGYTQEAKDNMRNAVLKVKIEKNGYLGGVELHGNLFYPRVRNNCNQNWLSNGGFRTEEECIEVLQEYTKDPYNFIKVDSPYKRKDGSVLKRNDRWGVKYKNVYLGDYDTEEEGWKAIENYQRDPENFTNPEKKVGSITKRCNRWRLAYKNKFLGSYESEDKAQEALERYIGDPENFIKPESKTYSITTQGNKWLLKSNGRIIKFYATQEEAEEARQTLQSSL
jgi:group I intron endonuclease